MRIIDEKTKAEMKEEVKLDPSEYVHRPKDDGARMKLLLVLIMPIFAVIVISIGLLVRGLAWTAEKSYLREAKVGATVSFGEKVQEEEETLTWTVLDRQGDRLLLLCNSYVGSVVNHNVGEGEAETDSWEHTVQREYLNGTFLQEAFSEKERKLLVETTLSSEENAASGFTSGGETTDYVFLLSKAELEKYKTYTGGNTTLLRSPGIAAPAFLRNGTVADVNTEGEELKYKPAIWIDISSIK